MVDLPTPAPTLPPLIGRARLGAWLDMLFVDHGLIRYPYLNRHRVSEALWRSGQPAPHHLRWAREAGIRTVLNLRGRRDTCGSYILEREACERLGLDLIDFPIRSRSALDRETLTAAAHVFERLRYPVLLHCKSGADRAGLMATLYLFYHEGMALPDAMGQLSLRYGHVRQARTGIIDHVFETFLTDTDGSRAAFLPWVAEVYDPVRLTAAFRENRFASFVVNRVLRRE